MEATASDPDVQQQYGMTVGTPDTSQINALGTLNLRGERSVTCKGDRDRASLRRAAAAGVARGLRRVPQAARRARARGGARQQYGTTPDLAAMPMYCIPFSFKDPFDTMDMRSTAAADARYDIDFPGARPHARRPAPAEGRHHLRQGGQHRVQRHPGRPGWAPRARRRCSCPTSATSAAAGPATRTAPTTRRARRRSARAQAPARRSAPTSSCAASARRPACRAAGRPTTTRWRCSCRTKRMISFHGRRHRRRHPQRPLRHPLPERHRLGEGARRAEGSGERLLRSARRVHHGAARERRRPDRLRPAASAPGTPGRSRACASA